MRKTKKLTDSICYDDNWVYEYLGKKYEVINEIIMVKGKHFVKCCNNDSEYDSDIDEEIVTWSCDNLVQLDSKSVDDPKCQKCLKKIKESGEKEYMKDLIYECIQTNEYSKEKLQKVLDILG
jgi:hypothetical protein